jgi:hypothetical protein
MSQGYEQMVAEVDRIVNSPYPTQLKVSTITLPLSHVYLYELTTDRNYIL